MKYEITKTRHHIRGAEIKMSIDIMWYTALEIEKLKPRLNYYSKSYLPFERKDYIIYSQRLILNRCELDLIKDKFEKYKQETSLIISEVFSMTYSGKKTIAYKLNVVNELILRLKINTMKTITVPLSKEAMHRLDYNESIDGDLLELELSDNELHILNKVNLFETINYKLGLNIDDYEDENLHDMSKIENLNEILTSMINKENEHIINSILELSNTALNKKTGIFFYF
ncbi:hypothetical protein AL507_18595 [Providencia stuartii]|nr:hypothetical protein AL507_18595 [Providencia stuartii]